MNVRKWFVINVGIGFIVIGAYALSYFKIAIAPESLPTIILIALAAYAAVVATLQYALPRAITRPDLRVEVLYGHMVLPGIAVSPGLLKLQALNRGPSSVTLNSRSFFLPRRRRAYLVGWANDCIFPCALTPGNACSLWKPAKDFAQELRTEGYRGRIKIVGVFTDSVNNVYKSKKFHFDIDGLLRS